VVVSPHHEEHLELCAGYALGSLGEEDRRRLEAHLATGCRECEEALAAFSDATVMLAASAPAAAPTPALRERVLAVVSGAATARPRPERAPERGRVVEMKSRDASWGWNQWLVAAAAVLLAVSSLVLWNRATRLERELVSSRKELSDLASRLEAERRMNEVLSATGARVATFELTAEGTAALRARATYDPATRNAVIVFDNFTPPAGHDYELWAIRDGKPSSLGLVKPDPSGHAVMHLETVGDPATLYAFAVSLEKEGGSPDKNAPAGPVIMLGKLSG
jgi:anti-sigma-K factor RskA